MDETGSNNPKSRARRVVARNALIMMLAQILGIPLSMLTNILMGRQLGPTDYGQYYLLTTFATLAFLIVDWGLAAIMPARIANDHAAAGRYLGSAMAWTVGSSIVVLLVMAGGAFWLGKTDAFLTGLVLVGIGQALALIVKNVADAVRGFERTDVFAYAQVGTQFLTAILVVSALWWWGNLLACLAAIALASLLVLLGVWPSLRSVGISRLEFDRTTLSTMLSAGTSFLILNMVLYLQPVIDAYFLQRYASEEAIGWLAAARKLINPMLVPASAMIAALYPTLCRLWTQDRSEYLQTARATLQTAIIITVPLAVGCAVFAEVGIMLFSAEAYAPARDNLRILSGYIFVVYLTMIVGTCINAAGRHRSWAVIQSLCLVISVVADPLLIPWFQKNMNNGGLGVAIVTVGSESLMLLAGLWLIPRGIFDRSVAACLARALTAGGAMIAAGWVLSGVTYLVAAPVAGVCYVAVLYMVGGVKPEHLQGLRSIFKRSAPAS